MEFLPLVEAQSVRNVTFNGDMELRAPLLKGSWSESLNRWSSDLRILIFDRETPSHYWWMADGNCL